MTKRTYISVILPLKLEWEPCYYLPEDIDGSTVSVGDRVIVMFARRKYTGAVSAVDITPDTDLRKIQPVISVEKDLGRIFPKEIELWRRVADYYLCSIGEVYKAAYPIGKINMEQARALAVRKVHERREKILAMMRDKVLRIEARLRRKEELIASTREGTKARARYIEEAEKIRCELKTAADALAAATLRPQSVPYSSEQYTTTELTISDRQNHMNPELIDDSGNQPTGISLSPAQKAAYAEIRKGFAAKMPVLLHGVTGSGKTEIYISLAKEAMNQGKDVLYLVPEIALSRQLEDRLHTHFGNQLLTFHSGETASQRRNTAEAVRACADSGERYIVLGTRSSLFLPHHNLGLIIVDEEHDTSYKQDSPAPRYNGRDAALMLSIIHSADIILGSATPSLEETYNCSAGRHMLVGLQESYHRAERSTVEIIDTKSEWKKNGMTGCFSRKLISHIEKTLAENGQVMILRSRRAWATAMQCSSCGDIVRCPHCNVSMSLHKNSSPLMVCHYCGRSIPYTGKCCKCNGSLTLLGTGTQKVEEEAAKLFPTARIARLDSDTAQNKAFESRTIKSFEKGEIDILIGTQIVAKGFDFSRLKLVAVIAADALLGAQDFRADEKAVQLLEQFRGRCGRREEKGLLVIQTSNPEHPIYQQIISIHPDDYIHALMQERKLFRFPPFTRIVEIIIKDKDKKRAGLMGGRLQEALEKRLSEANPGFRFSQITGPYAPAVDKIADQNILVIRINLNKDRTLSEMKRGIKESISAFEKTNGYDGHITVNVDPA